ncbi:MAG: hypothetical protein ACR2FY_07280 [Pirellulaceae bacterium]
MLSKLLYIACFFAVLSVQVTTLANDAVLSREESLGAMFRGGDSEFKVLMFVNPSVLPTLRRMLRQYPDLPGKTTWTTIGCVGTQRDVAFIRRILEKDARGEHDPEKAFGAASAINSLGLLARRDVPGAKELLADIQQPAFWEGEPLRLYKGDRADVRSEDEIQAMILDTMGYAKDPGIVKRSEMVVAQVKDPIRLSYWKNRLHLDILVRVGHGLDTIEKRGLDWQRRDDCLLQFHLIPADKRSLMGLPAPPTPNQLVTLREAWRIRKIQGVETIRVLTKSEAETLVLEAQKEYERFTAAISQKDVKTMRETLMSKGELFDRQFRHEEMSRPEITRLETELDQLQKREREIIKSVSTAHSEPIDFVASMEADAGDYSGKNTKVIVVSWKLKGTQDIGKMILKSKLNYYPTVGEDDNLMVVMKKKDGTWYWNPFGW